MARKTARKAGKRGKVKKTTPRKPVARIVEPVADTAPASDTHAADTPAFV